MGFAEKQHGQPERKGQRQRDPDKEPGGEEFAHDRLTEADRHNSIVPLLRSSAHNGIDTAGISPR